VHRARRAAAAPRASAELLEDARAAVQYGYPAMAAFNAALAVACSTDDVEAAYAAERAWQSAWISATFTA
jgi:hypothetical protein